VPSEPELGGYYHEFFLRDKPHLAAQMFCKNARSKLAMEAVSETVQQSKPAPVVPTEPVPTAAPQMQQTQQQFTPSSAAFLAALQQKVPDASNNQMKSFPSYGNNPLQLLQLQMEIMQQEQSMRLERLQKEQAMRMLMEHAALQNTMLPPQPNMQQSRLLQMYQLMEVQQQQQKRQQVRNPTNPRASAA
jgi:hypothetical protein